MYSVCSILYVPIYSAHKRIHGAKGYEEEEGRQMSKPRCHLGLFGEEMLDEVQPSVLSGIIPSDIMFIMENGFPGLCLISGTVHPSATSSDQV